jgi:HNH endonuclease
MADLSQYKLTRWRRLLLLREVRDVTTPDGSTRRMSFCPMCGLTMPTYRLQAHHVRPKSRYPQLAYHLDNGICLCIGCHMHIVHAGNSFRDLAELHHWRFFVPSFDRYTDLAHVRHFNERNQPRLTG